MAEKKADNILTTIPGQAWIRKMSARYMDSSTSDHSFSTLEDNYRTKMFFPFLDQMQEELQKRFQENNSTKTGQILGSLYKITDPEVWKIVNDDDTGTEALQTICQFYGSQQEQKLRAELRVFHASYENPKKDVKSMLHTIKEHKLHDVFPTSVSFLQIYATIPATTPSPPVTCRGQKKGRGSKQK